MPNQDIYYRLCSKDKSYRGNMPETVGRMFLTLFDNEDWTWSGLSELIKARFNDDSISELLYFLGQKSKKKVSNA